MIFNIVSTEHRLVYVNVWNGKPHVFQSTLCVFGFAKNNRLSVKCEANILEGIGSRRRGQRVIFGIQVSKASGSPHHKRRKAGGCCRGGRHDSGLSCWCKRELPDGAIGGKGQFRAIRISFAWESRWKCCCSTCGGFRSCGRGSGLRRVRVTWFHIGARMTVRPGVICGYSQYSTRGIGVVKATRENLMPVSLVAGDDPVAGTRLTHLRSK